MCVFGQGPDHAPESGLLLGEANTAHASRTVLFKPLLGIWSMNKAYPLWAAPLQFMCALSESTQAFQETDTGTERSQSYVVEAPHILCSTMTVGSRILNSDRKHILSG